MQGRKGPLIVLEYPEGKKDRMNSKKYQKQVLEDCLKDFYVEIERERGLIWFQQDRAASHTSKSIKD